MRLQDWRGAKLACAGTPKSIDAVILCILQNLVGPAYQNPGDMTCISRLIQYALTGGKTLLLQADANHQAVSLHSVTKQRLAPG